MTQVLEQHRQHRQNSEISQGDAPAQVMAPACEGKTDLFFSERTTDMRIAQVICATCVMRDPCLAAAREQPPFAGVWGGVIFVNGEELLLKRGRGRPRKSEQLDNARVLKALGATSHEVNEDEEDSEQVLQRQIA